MASSAIFSSLRRRNSPTFQAFITPVDLSEMALLATLTAVSSDIVSCFSGKSLAFQRPNSRSLVRKNEVFVVLFEYVGESSLNLPKSAVVCFQEMYVLLYRSKILLDYCVQSSKLWLLLQNHSISGQFHDLNQEILTLLDVFPWGDLDMGDDVMEQIELLQKQSRKAKLLIDKQDEVLRCKFYSFLDEFEGGRTLDSVELYRFFVERMGILDVKSFMVEIEFLEEQIVNHEGDILSQPAVSDQLMFYDSCKRINLDTLQAFPTEKVIDDGAMYFWLHKLNWNKCFGILFPLSTMVIKSLSPRWLLPISTVHTCVDLMGDVSGMNVLPQELIEDIVSRTSPVDVCGSLSVVSRKFCSAAKSDHVWERFLPADLISRRAKPSESHFKIYAEDPWKKIDLDTLQAFPTKKDLYLFLSDNPLLIDDGDMYFWLDRLSGSKCFILVPEKLSIPEPDGWHGPYSYYELTLPFRIEGKISTSLLSPNTLYTAYLSFDFTCSSYFTGFGEEEPLQTCVEIDGGCESESRIVYIPFMPCEYERHTNILKCRPPNMPVLSGPQYPRRSYAIYELELGDYFNKDGGGDNRELKMCLSEIKTGEAKGGICLCGIEIKPKNCR